ncbi:MAG: hypothetical protein E7324_04640 [Clostridiales bacterium]|nr:hypothetical protein [Clostridiales bacterium]
MIRLQYRAAYQSQLARFEKVLPEEIKAAILVKQQPLKNAIWLYHEIYPAAPGYEIHGMLTGSGEFGIDSLFI